MKRNTATIMLLSLCLLMLAACSVERLPGGIDLEKAENDIAALDILPYGEAPSDEILRDVLGVDPELIEESLIFVPSMNVSASTYWIVLAKDGEKDALKTQIDAYFEAQLEMWSRYLPDQYDIIKGVEYREIETAKGVYLVYAATEDNSAVLAAVDGAVG